MRTGNGELEMGSTQFFSKVFDLNSCLRFNIDFFCRGDSFRLNLELEFSPFPRKIDFEYACRMFFLPFPSLVDGLSLKLILAGNSGLPCIFDCGCALDGRFLLCTVDRGCALEGRFLAIGD